MKELLTAAQNWGGIIVLIILAVIGIIYSLAGSSTREERRLSGQDEEHYVLRLPVGRIVYPLVLLAAGFVLQAVCTPVEKYFFSDIPWAMPLIRLGIGVVFGLLFWMQLAKVMRRRVFVKGESIVVTPAIGNPIETNFKQIRTVANKLAGREKGVIGKKIRTKEGNRFEVINTMTNYDLFVEQLDAKVELPNLTKKLFKKRDKKEEVVHEPEEVVEEGPLPEVTPVAAAGMAMQPEPVQPVPVRPEPELPAYAAEPEMTAEEIPVPHLEFGSVEQEGETAVPQEIEEASDLQEEYPEEAAEQPETAVEAAEEMADLQEKNQEETAEQPETAADETAEDAPEGSDHDETAIETVSEGSDAAAEEESEPEPILTESELTMEETENS